jgi:hypothetical protein
MELLFFLGPCYLCSLAGLIMVIGGIWLLAKGKIMLDAKTGEVVDFDLPLLGKVKTNAPILGLFLIGSIPLIYPISTIREVMQGRDEAIRKSAESLKTAERDLDEAVRQRDEFQKKLGAVEQKIPRLKRIKQNVTSDTYPITIYVVNKITELDKEQGLSIPVPVYEGLDQYLFVGRHEQSVSTISVAYSDQLQSEKDPIILDSTTVTFKSAREGIEIKGPPNATFDPSPTEALRGPPPPEYRSTTTGPVEIQGGPR